MFEKKFPWGKLVFSFAMGALSGAAVALWFAPMKGEKLQKKVMDVVEDQVGNVEKIVKKVVNA